jgi:uncharacterized RDD family membrane protein YckC
LVQEYANVGAATGSLELEVTGGPAAGQQFSVHEDFRVGSAESGPGTLARDRWLSPGHAQFHRGPNGWAIEDLRSVEGTQLNGQPLRGAATLAPGDVIELGSSRIVVLPDAGSSAAVMHASSSGGMAETRRAEKRRDLDGRRLIAFLLDSILFVPVGAVVVYSIGRGRPIFWLALIALGLTYFFLCETLSGQTLGKRVTGLRVVRIDGRPLNPRSVAARTVLRLVDQQLANLVGMITMILTGQRRQRLGDLAARTAVTRASAPYPRPARRGWERAAVWGYPAVWLAPAVLLFALVPDARLLPCGEAGISAGSGNEGSCLVHSRSGDGVFSVVNSGHTLHMPGYEVKLLRTATHPAPRWLRGRRYYVNESTLVVGFKLAITNTADKPLRFDYDSRHVVLGAPRLDNSGMAAVRQLPPAAHGGFRSFAERRPIRPGHKGVAWVSFAIPPVALPQLRQPAAGLALMPDAGGLAAGLEHVGEIRLWRASTPSGIRALSGLHD